MVSRRKKKSSLSTKIRMAKTLINLFKNRPKRRKAKKYRRKKKKGRRRKKVYKVNKMCGGGFLGS